VTPIVVAGHTTKVDAGNVTSRTIGAPTHAPGNYILIAVVHDSSAVSLTIAGFDSILGDVSVANAATVALFVKRAGGSEPATYTILSSVSERVVAIAFAVSGVGGIHSIANPLSGTGATATVPAMTTGAVDILRISIVATDSTATTTPMGTAAGHTVIASLFGASAGGLSVQHKNLPTPGVDPSATVSLAASDQWAGLAVGLSSETEVHATKVGVYLDLQGASLRTTKAGVYIEAIQNQMRATKAGVYIEAIQSQLRTTKVGYYVELEVAQSNHENVWISVM
jgi:hypothetical protein